MSLTRRGGDFFWLKCDACSESSVKLLQWVPGARFAARILASIKAKDFCALNSWRISPNGASHVCASCLDSAGEERKAARRHVAV